MRRRPETDRIGRLVRDRPRALARGALGSWAVGLLIGLADLAWSGGAWWPFVVFPVFVMTVTAAVALFQDDPERAGLDALRGGLLAAVPASLVVGWAALRTYEAPAAGWIALVCMASAAIGAVIGALCGPVAGWALRAAARDARALIRGQSRR